MSERKVRFLGAARAELRRAVDHYDAQVVGLGDEFTDEVERCLREVATHPEIGSVYLSGTRRILTRRFPFDLVYRVQPEEVVIVAVAHQRRRPGYWLRRL